MQADKESLTTQHQKDEKSLMGKGFEQIVHQKLANKWPIST